MSDSSATPVQSPKRPAADLSNLPASSLPISPPATCSDEVAARRKNTVEIQPRLRKRYKPYQRRIAPPLLEVRFISRALGDTSYTDLGFEDVIEGGQLFTRGLSHLSDTLLHKAYTSKVAFKKTILHRIALSQANLDALERRNEFFRGLEEEVTAERAMDDEELDCIRSVLGDRGIDETDLEIEYQHAVYEDELVAFSIAEMQLAQMADTGRIRPQHDSGDNPSGPGSGKSLAGDLVYKPDNSLVS
ncbi:hypothetical protein HD554DRAFT_2068032 [Boletus coccyginus]|nr:hypothetical protein HD554DRAFT_2068032 [Boletus coccyginus]